MKFRIDAQLPKRLANALTAAGHNSLHTLDLPLGNQTSDEALMILAAKDQRILVTKDSDFVTSFHLNRFPPKLLLVSTGNIDNDILCHLFLSNIVPLERAYAAHSFMELSRTALTLHE